MSMSSRKANRKKKKLKTVLSVVRTILATVILILGIIAFYHAINWYPWAPNNDVGFFIVCMAYLAGIIFVVAGGYGLSPIYWEAIYATIVLAKVDVYNDQEDEEEKHEKIEKAQKRIRKFQKWFLW